MENTACITGCAPQSLGEGFLDVLSAEGFSCTIQWRNRRTEHPYNMSIQNTLASCKDVEDFIAEVKTKIANIGLLVLAHGGYSNSPDVDMRWSDLGSRILIARGLLDALSPEGKIIIIGSRHGEETFDRFDDKKLPRQREYAQIYREVKGIPQNPQCIDMHDKVIIPIVGGAMTSGLHYIASLLNTDPEKLQMTTSHNVATQTLDFIRNGGTGTFQIK